MIPMMRCTFCALQIAQQLAAAVLNLGSASRTFARRFVPKERAYIIQSRLEANSGKHCHDFDSTAMKNLHV